MDPGKNNKDKTMSEVNPLTTGDGQKKEGKDSGKVDGQERNGQEKNGQEKNGLERNGLEKNSHGENTQGKNTQEENSWEENVWKESTQEKNIKDMTGQERSSRKAGAEAGNSNRRHTKDKTGKKEVKKKYRTRRIILAEIIFMILFTITAFSLQSVLALLTFSQDISRSEKHIKNIYEDAQQEKEQAIRNIDELHIAQVGVCLELSVEKGWKNVDFNIAKDRFGLENYYILDRNGNVKETSNPDPVDFRKDNLASLYKIDKVDYTFYGNAVVRHGPDGEEYRCYSSVYLEPVKRKEDNIIVFEVKSDIIGTIENETLSPEVLLKNESVGYEGFAFVVNDKTGEFLYKPDKMKVKSTGIAAADLKDLNEKYTAIFPIDGNFYIVKGVDVEDGSLVCLAITLEEIGYTVLMGSAGVILVFFFISSLIVVYAVLLEEDYLRRKNKGSWKPVLKGWIYYNHNMGKKIILFSVIGMIMVAMTTAYFQTLLVLSRRSQNTMDIASDAVSSIKKKKNYSKDVKDAAESIQASVFVYLVTAFDENNKLDNRLLKNVQNVSNIESITVFDGNMENVIYTSNNFIPREVKRVEGTDLLNTVRNELDLYSYYIGDPFVIKDSRDREMNLQYFGWKQTKKDGTENILLCLFQTNFIEVVQDSTILKSVLSKIETGDGGRAWSVSKEDRTFSYYPNEAVIGKKVSKYGIKKANLENDYNGYIKLNGKTYYAAVKETDNNYIFVTVPWRTIMSDRLPMCIATALSAFLVFLLLYLRIAFERKIGEREYIYPVKKRSGSADDVIVKVMKRHLIMTAAFVCLVEIVAHNFLDDDNIVRYIFYGNWNKGFNIFSITECMVTICKGVIVISFLIWILRSMESIFSSAGSTVCRLLASLLKYVGVVVIAFMSLSCFGVNPSTLVASFGILTTVIGLGANSLLQDIFAGLFIIFEGDLRVNDEVLLGDSKAKIVEIGIRTTKFRDHYNNTRIINNKNIIDITTRSKGAYKIFYNLKVDNSISNSQVMDVLDSALAYLKSRYPEYVMDVENRGIILGNEDFTQYRFVVRTKDKTREKTDVMVREEMTAILNESDISGWEWM